MRRIHVPNDAEVYNGNKDEDGCPDKRLIVLGGMEPNILDKIYFATNEAIIKPKSCSILDAIAQLLQENPHIHRLSIRGNVDMHEQRRKNNHKLGLSRAEAVIEYLVAKNIDRERLTVIDDHADRPINSEKTKRARETNRRVEFEVESSSCEGESDDH